MNILAIDSSSKILSLAVCRNNRLILECNLRLERKLSDELITVLKSTLSKAKISKEEIDAFSVGLGPGSFTALRIGISTMKGLAYSLRKPLVGIPTLDALAFNAQGHNGLICPIIDAKRGNVYSCIYEFRGNRLTKKSDYLLVDIKSLVKKLNRATVFLGDGISLYKKEIVKFIKGALFLSENLWYPKARFIGELGFHKLSTRKKFDSAKIIPLYLYPKECQITAKKSIETSS